VDFVGAFVQEITVIASYALLIGGVYMLFRISSDLGEIKQLLKDRTRSAPPSPALSSALAPLANMRSTDDASEYAEQLLRAVNAESRPPIPEGSPAPSEPR
jgi:hypothetical protein